MLQKFFSLKNNIFPPLSLASIFFLTLFHLTTLSVYGSPFSSLHDSEDSLICDAREAARISYDAMHIHDYNINHLVTENGVHIYPFKGHTGSLIFGKYDHTLGFVSFDGSSNKRVIVTFHGSKNHDDWLSNFQASGVPTHWAPGKVHEGFLEMAHSGYDTFVPIIKGYFDGQGYDPEEFEFIFTGHSLGGAAASLAACRFFSSYGKTVFPSKVLKKNQVKLVTFSTPCVGNEEFGNWASRVLRDNAIRFVSNFDVVPSVPFWHQTIGQDIDVLFSEKLEDQGKLACKNLSDGLRQGGLKPKVNALKDIAHIIYGFYRPLSLVSQGFSYAGKFIDLCHQIPGEDVILRAFFQYQFRTRNIPEGSEYRHDFDDIEPGHVSAFDPYRNPLIRGVLSFFGGY